MRIFSPQLGLDPDSSSGGEVFDVELLTGLAERGHEIDVLLRKGQKAPNVKNLNIHYLPFNIKTGVYSTLIPWVFQFNRTAKGLVQKADIFRVHMPYFVALGAVLFKKTVKKCPPLWFHYHHIENEAQMRLFKSLAKYADGITAVNMDTLLDLEKICTSIRGKPSGIIMNGIDVDLFKPVKPNMKIRGSLGIRKDDKVVLYVGHLIHRKGVDVLMNSWENVREEFKDVHLVLIGRGMMGDSLEDLVKQYQKNDRNIHHIPYVEKKENLVKYYNISDVFAFPTRLEGFGRTVAEAMACGLPVVTTNAKGVRDVVLDGKTGYKVNIGDVEQFSEKLKILLSDDSLKGRMGSAGRKRAEENFTWGASLDNVERFMERLVSVK